MKDVFDESWRLLTLFTRNRWEIMKDFFFYKKGRRAKNEKDLEAIKSLFEDRVLLTASSIIAGAVVYNEKKLDMIVETLEKFTRIKRNGLKLLARAILKSACE